jgi:hypothetical protein
MGYRLGRAEYDGERIVVTDRPSCPHCNSRRNIGEVVAVIEWQGLDVAVWTCFCPSFKGARKNFGQVLPFVNRLVVEEWT